MRLPYKDFLQAHEAPNTMLKVYHEVALVELAEINLGPIAFRAT
jgi:hypothetical protein